MNQVALVGNITDDPELRYTQSGAALAGFTVAVSHRSKHNGQWQDVTDGFDRPHSVPSGMRARAKSRASPEKRRYGDTRGSVRIAYRYDGP